MTTYIDLQHQLDAHNDKLGQYQRSLRVLKIHSWVRFFDRKRTKNMEKIKSAEKLIVECYKKIEYIEGEILLMHLSYFHQRAKKFGDPIATSIAETFPLN